jgi:hypothetical protein
MKTVKSPIEAYKDPDFKKGVDTSFILLKRKFPFILGWEEYSKYNTEDRVFTPILFFIIVVNYDELSSFFNLEKDENIKNWIIKKSYDVSPSLGIMYKNIDISDKNIINKLNNKLEHLYNFFVHDNQKLYLSEFNEYNIRPHILSFKFIVT